MPEATFNLMIVSADRILFDDRAAHARVPGAAGYLGVLAYHAPLVTALKKGQITVRTQEGVEKVFAVDGEGVMEVLHNEVTIFLHGTH
jgi:F-type H+-transporting ATPase subunit epsilon